MNNTEEIQVPNIEEYSLDEHKYPKISLRSDHEFYHDDDNVVYQCVNIRRKLVKKEEFWEVVVDKSVVLKINASDLTSEQISSLYSVQGLTKAINVVKSGKISLKDIIKVL
jgi:hypothetical protein